MIKPENFDKNARRKAEEHWKWLETVLRKVYVNAMIHGIGHGAQDPEFKHVSMATAGTTEVQHD